MMDISQTEFIGIFLIAVLLRTWPLFLRDCYESSDSWFHLWRASEIERNGYRIPYENKQFILGGRTCYPPLLHYCILFIPKKHRERWSGLISPVFDIFTLFPFLLLYWWGFWIESTSQLLICLVAYFVSPISLQFHATSMYSVKPRNMGRLFLICSLVFFYEYEILRSLTSFVLSSIFFGLLLISSKFALQAFLFISLFLVYLYTSIVFIILFGFAFAVAITKGFYIFTLREHILHQKMYFQKMKHYSTASVINSKQDILFILNPLNLFRKASEYVYILLYRFSLSHAAFIMPDVSLFLCLLILGKVNFGLLFYMHGNHFLILWFVACIFAWAVTSTKLLISLGQPTRYLEYALFPGVILLSQWNFYTFFGNIWFFVLFCISIYFIVNIQFFNGFSRRVMQSRKQKKQIVELRKFLMRLQSRRIMFVPMKLALIFADIHKHRFFWASPFVEPYVKPSFWDETFKPKHFPFPKSLVKIHLKYDINTIIIDDSMYMEYRRDLEQLGAKAIETKGNFIIYDVPNV